MKRVHCCALVFALAALTQQSVAQERPSNIERRAEPQAIDVVIQRLGNGPLMPTAVPPAQSSPPARAITEAEIVKALHGSRLLPDQSAALWGFIADEDNAPLATLPLIKALMAASHTPEAREAMWSELSGAAGEVARLRRSRAKTQPLLAFFERHRNVLLPLLTELRETEPSCDAMIQLMATSRVFGADLYESVMFVTDRIPGAVARHIEHERGEGRPVYWERAAMRAMVGWTRARYATGAARAPRLYADLEAAGATLITMFNSLQATADGFREEILQGQGPVGLFNAAIAGEQELYRVGTSGYRDVLHAAIISGMDQAGSFEDFVGNASPRRFVDDAARNLGRRRIAFLRIASYFGLLEPVFVRVRDKDRLIGDLIASLDDPGSFEENSRVVIAILGANPALPAVEAVKAPLLDRLYDRYRSGGSKASRNAYGSLLSVYQTTTGDHRDRAIDQDFALNSATFNIPFDSLFSPDGKGGLNHRMFMRMDHDTDASSTYSAFNTLMISLNAAVRKEQYFDVFTVSASGRTIEIYANRPTPSGVKHGIPEIAKALAGHRVETVIGRGHTAIIAPLQGDAKRVLGERVKDVAAVIVGSCGGDAAVRDLIATFGYRPFITTKSTGRQIINDAIIKSYIAALQDLSPGERLSMPNVLQRAVQRFMQSGVDSDLRHDASLYQVNMATVFTALLYDAHVRVEPARRAALQ